jgi:predicted RNA-binding protein with TRAM domain
MVHATQAVAVSEQGLSLRKEKEMKTTVMSVMALALMVVSGCMSSRGGGMSESEGFKIGASMFTTDIKQGDRQTITISLHREKYFREDVKLEFKASEGISVQPTHVVIKSSDTPDVPLQITAPKDAALGEYRVFVTGTPETGQPTTKEIKVKVVAP